MTFQAYLTKIIFIINNQRSCHAVSLHAGDSSTQHPQGAVTIFLYRKTINIRFISSLEIFPSNGRDPEPRLGGPRLQHLLVGQLQGS